MNEPSEGHFFVRCPRCSLDIPLGIGGSSDVQATFQGGEIPCSGCDGIIRLPDVQLSATPGVAILDLAHATAEFDKLLEASQRANQLYYLLTLLGLRGLKRNMDFMIEVNRLTSEVVFARTTAHPPKSILAHEMLFVLQANLEAKAFYAVWRNFISPLVNRPVKPEPWTGDDEIRISTKTGRVDLKTGGIIKGIVRDLRIANFDWLAREFEHTHSGIGAHIRNSVAHATFLCPSDKNGPAWVFAEYVCDATGAVRVREHLLSHGDFTQFMRRFLTFRSAAASAYDARLKTASESTEEFVAENQMNKGEMLQCRLEKGTVRVTSQGTPFW